MGQVLTATDPLLSVTRYLYDARGNPISVTRDGGGNGLKQLTSMTYSAVGNVISVTDPNRNVTSNTYDAARRLTTSTSPGSSAAPNGVVTSLAYDPDGRVLRTQQSANGAVLRTASRTYTMTGQPAATTDANGNATTYAYDAADRLVGATDPLGRTTAFAYDAMGRRTQVLNLAIQAAPLLQQGYTPDGLQASLTDANSHTTNFSYDGFDRLSTTTYPNASTEALTYDADGNVLSRTTRANQIINFTYDTLNRLATKTPPSPWAKVTYSFDLIGRLTSVSDNSAAITPVGGGPTSYTTSYAYDALNRPIGATWSPAPTAAAPTASSVTFAHTYNKANQRAGQTATDNSWWYYPAATASTVSYTANALNQYTAVGSVTPSYDGNGNLTFDGTYTYGYDTENRLTSVMQGSTAAASYAHDAQGRRKVKTVGSATTSYITDADNREVLEYDGTSGQILRWNAYGLGPNDALNQINVAAHTRATFIPDIQGSILASLDSSSGALTKFGYLPYGKSASVPASFGFTGQRADPETNGLYYYHARMYMPAWGRFMQVDPVGYAAGANLYRYVHNDPLNAVDSTGLASDGPVSGQTGVGLGSTPDQANEPPPVQLVSDTGPESKLGIGGQAFDPSSVLFPTGNGSQLLSLGGAPPAIAPPPPALALPSPPPGTQPAWAGPIYSLTAPPEGLTAYRTYGGETQQQGTWFSPTQPSSSSSAIQTLSLPPGNTAQFASPVQIPPGMQYQIGTAAGAFGQPGGGAQIKALGNIPAENYGPGIAIPP